MKNIPLKKLSEKVLTIQYYSYILKKEQTSYDENEFTRLFDKYLRPKPAFYAVLNTALQL